MGIWKFDPYHAEVEFSAKHEQVRSALSPPVHPSHRVGIDLAMPN
jgi:hypothetical protein